MFEPWLTRWHLRPVGEAFKTQHSGSHLIPVLYGGAPAMLKIAPGLEERRGAVLMVWYGGNGAVRVLELEGEAVLLERATGRRNLADMARNGQDDAATHILCATITRLHAPRATVPPTTLVPLSIWFRELTPAVAPNHEILAKSDMAARELLSAPRDVVVLHGDIHHGNVLDGEGRGWLAIDPKGLIGERGFDYAHIMCNPDREMATAPGRLRRQAQIVAQIAGLDLTRLLMWILAYAGLSACWTLDSGGDPGPALAIAEIAVAELTT
ncbi:MAG: 3'-kinase [Proteobacteria bacterium]|nr:3'-kinase [Pseudomonadota bacterium]MBI3499486.1 3'-kinase [Pseudomonadota bacterium]